MLFWMARISVKRDTSDANRNGQWIITSRFDDPAIIAGQGTIGLEIATQVPDLDAVIVPIGGGGLIAGIATALKR